MKIVNARDGVLTNLEVKMLLEQQQAARLLDERKKPLPGARRGLAGNSSWQSRQNAATISDQVLSYLADNNCSAQTRESIQVFMHAIEPYALTRAESLALVNTQPQSVVEIYLLVEECEERFSPDDVLELLRLCQTLGALDRDVNGLES